VNTAAAKPQVPLQRTPHVITMGAAEWSATVIARGRAAGEVPRYGGEEWSKLSTSDPRFVASVAIAAECWRDHVSFDRVEQQLADELVATGWVPQRQAAPDFAELAAGVRRLVKIPTEAELRQRRGVT
jgi:hypothetical protein